MIKKMYAIRDKVADMFFQPFLCNNDDVAKRDFVSAGTNGSIPHISDYELHFICCFDTVTGQITDCKDTIVMSGVEVGDDNV